MFPVQARRRRAAFTLIELLVVVAIIALLISILIRPSAAPGRSRVSPSVSRTSRARVRRCTNTLRSTFGALPPKYLWRLGSGGVDVKLINSVLADYMGQPFRQPDDGSYPIPTGVFRCPDVTTGGDNSLRWTHSGVLQHAPYTWLFNVVRINEFADFVSIEADAPDGWITTAGGDRWHRLDPVPRPAEIIALVDNVTFFYPGHGHREARESIGYGAELAPVAGPDGEDNRGSHEAPGRRPAAFVDGHAAAVPSAARWWLDVRTHYQPPDAGSAAVDLYARDGERFLFFVRPEQFAGDTP